METDLSADVVAKIQNHLIQHSCTGSIHCASPPPTQAKLEQLPAALDDLDLDCVKFKLMHPTEGEGWTKEQADRVEKLYKRFLLMATTDSRPFMPTREIDEMWHTHILDTQKYEEDCRNLFGFTLHHFPYFGLRGSQDALLMVKIFIENCRRYEARFGEPYAKIPTELIRDIPELQSEIDFSSLQLGNLTSTRPTISMLAA